MVRLTCISAAGLQLQALCSCNAARPSTTPYLGSEQEAQYARSANLQHCLARTTQALWEGIKKSCAPGVCGLSWRCEERAEPALKRRSASSASCIRRLAASTRSFRPPAPPLEPAPAGAAVMVVCVAWTAQDEQGIHLHHAEGPCFPGPCKVPAASWRIRSREQ